MAVVPDRRRASRAAELIPPPAVDIVGDEEIEVAIPIDVEKGAARAPQPWRLWGGVGAARVRLLGEPAAADVSVQGVATDTSDVEVDPAVVVVIAGARPHTVAAVADARGGGDVRERAITAVPEQAMPGAP